MWESDDKSLRRTFELPDFAAAIRLVNDVAAIAEEMDHHPDIDVRYNRVTFVLSTHSKGGVTELDHELARRIDGAAGG